MFQSLLDIQTIDHFRGNVGRFARTLCRLANCYNLVYFRKTSKIAFWNFSHLVARITGAKKVQLCSAVLIWLLHFCWNDIFHRLFTVCRHFK